MKPTVTDLSDLCRVAVESAGRDEEVEAFAEESKHTEVRARKGEVEALEFSESRGLGVRLILEDRLGYAWVADPSPDEVAQAVVLARENAGFGTPDKFNRLPEATPETPIEPLPRLFRETQSFLPTDSKVRLALDLERVAVTSDPRVTKVEEALYGDAVSRVVMASTEGLAEEYRRTDCWCVVATLAEDGDETQAGFAFRLARAADELEWADCASEAADRAARLLGSTKPVSARMPVVLDPHAAASFLGVLSGALSAESVQKGRSLFADSKGEQVGSEAVTLIDDGRLLAGPAAAPFDDEGVPTERTALIEAGVLRGFLHNTYSARRGGERSTGNASRAGYRGPPGVAPSNFYVDAGEMLPEEILRAAEGGILIQDVSGVHSGANPISGEFSVGATGLRIKGGVLGEPLREMTIASTIPEMLKGVTAVGNDLRFFSGVGSPTILIGEMTIAGT